MLRPKAKVTFSFRDLVPWLEREEPIGELLLVWGAVWVTVLGSRSQFLHASGVQTMGSYSQAPPAASPRGPVVGLHIACIRCNWNASNFTVDNMPRYWLHVTKSRLPAIHCDLFCSLAPGGMQYSRPSWAGEHR